MTRGCIPIGRENGLKIRTVSVRVRPALLKLKSNYET